MEFWEQLEKVNITEENILVLPEGNELLLEGVREIYVRDSYETLYEIIHHGEHKGKHVIITGNPGIGKSCFLLYQMYRFRKENKDLPLFYTSAVLSWHILFHRDMVQIFTPAEMPHNQRRLRQLTYLYDCGTKGDQIAAYPPTLARKTIIATSPDKTHTQSFWKAAQDVRVEAVRLYMPPWSLDELKYFEKQRNISEKVLNDRFLIWGGIPRYVLAQNEDKSSIDEGIVNTPPESIAGLASMLRVGVIQSHVSHKLLHLCPKDDKFKDVDVLFASEYIKNGIYKKYEDSCRSIVCAIIRANRTFSGFEGQVFEQIAHGKLASGCRFQVKSLHDNSTSSLDLRQPRLVHFQDIADLRQYKIAGANYTEQVYLQPQPKNFKSLDSIMLLGGTNRAIGFQITVQTQHSIHKKGLQDVRKALCKTEHDPFDIYFVVPPVVLNEYNKLQPYVGTRNKTLKSASALPRNVTQWVLLSANRHFYQ